PLAAGWRPVDGGHGGWAIRWNLVSPNPAMAPDDIQYRPPRRPRSEQGEHVLGWHVPRLLLGWIGSRSRNTDGSAYQYTTSLGPSSGAGRRSGGMGGVQSGRRFDQPPPHRPTPRAPRK